MFFEKLQIDDRSNNWKNVLLYSLIAIAFSIFFRQIYLYEIGKLGIDITYNSAPMINNNDGYYWAEGARDILAGHHQTNDLSPIDYPASKLTALLAKILPISLDTLIFYLPGILGSFLAVPLVLIGYELGSAFLGFLAALLAPIVWSYYHRTMYGYYDTDMLVIVLPLFAIWGMILALKEKKIATYWIAPLFLALSIWWHAGLFNVANAVVVLAFIYVLIFDRQKQNFLFLVLLLLALFQIPTLAKIALIFIANFFFYRYSQQLEKHLRYFLLFAFVVYIFFGGYEWILKLMHSSYLTRSTTISEEGLKFYGVINTVREAGHISFDTLVHRISGSYIGFFVGALGYLLLLIRYPWLLVSLPMVGLGLYALWGGLRFTIFAVPFFALGDAYVVLLIAKWLRGFFLDEKVGKVFYYLFGLAAIATFIYPNYTHAKKYIMPTVFSKHEVEILQKFKNIAKRDDYVLTWWDYGYPIRYYADVKTLIDGGKHSGDVNFPVSFALSTSSQRASYNMALLDVYFTEEFYDKKITDKTYVEAMMEYLKVKDPGEFLSLLNQQIKLPPVKEEVYYYLPYRMLSIFPTVAKFSQIDLKTGKVKEQHFYYFTDRMKKKANILYLGSGLALLLDKAQLRMANQQYPIHRYTTVLYKEDGNADVRVQNFSSNSTINIIHLPQFGRILVVDDFYYNSTYFQLFIFENYNQDLFEPVILDPMVKIYRVKK